MERRSTFGSRSTHQASHSSTLRLRRQLLTLWKVSMVSSSWVARFALKSRVPEPQVDEVAVAVTVEEVAVMVVTEVAVDIADVVAVDTEDPMVVVVVADTADVEVVAVSMDTETVEVEEVAAAVDMVVEDEVEEGMRMVTMIRDREGDGIKSFPNFVLWPMQS